MTHLYRRDNGRPIRSRMDELGLSCPTLAEATRHVDPDGKGVSAAAIGNLVGRGSSAHDRGRLRTAWLIAEVLNAPLQDLFSMHSPLTVTDERAIPVQTKTTEPALPAPLLRPAEFRQRYGISRWTENDWLKRGCPVRRLPSGHKRFDLAAVEAWLDEQEPSAEQSA